MPEKPLLLSAAKSGILVDGASSRRLRLAAVALGVLVVLVGAADVTTRLAHAVFGDAAGAVAFAPAVALVEPSILGGASTGAPLVPARLSIPSIGVDAPVENVGKKADGSMGAPMKFGDVAWYSQGSMPGAGGSAVFAGHVDNALTTAGVFENLSKVKQGDYITVSGSTGTTLVYRVTKTASYAPDQAPTADIFATTGPSQLVLITCTGDWVPSQHQFDGRLVVFASLASSW